MEDNRRRLHFPRYQSEDSNDGSCSRYSGRCAVYGDGDADDVENDEIPKPPGATSGSQRWKNVKAVVAYYCSLRKIKRNVIFAIVEKKANMSIISCVFVALSLISSMGVISVSLMIQYMA